MTNRQTHIALLATLLALITPTPGLSHCDTMDGPVVADGLRAIEFEDISPALKWVRPNDEEEIRGAFVDAMAVRGLDERARKLADRYFLETLVRIHRASENAPYAGIRPEGTPIDPAVVLADEALDRDDVDELVEAITNAIEEGIRERFEEARVARPGAEQSVALGREFVAAYVELTHYVERIHLAATSRGHGAATEDSHGGDH